MSIFHGDFDLDRFACDGLDGLSGFDPSRFDDPVIIIIFNGRRRGRRTICNCRCRCRRFC